MDQNTGSDSGLIWTVGDPLEDHHEDEVTEQTDHEEQLWDQHEENTAHLTKVSGEDKKRAEFLNY